MAITTALVLMHEYLSRPRGGKPPGEDERVLSIKRQIMVGKGYGKSGSKDSANGSDDKNIDPDEILEEQASPGKDAGHPHQGRAPQVSER